MIVLYRKHSKIATPEVITVNAVKFRLFEF